MEEVAYVLCTLTALACAALLARGYLRTRARLLAWCGCFFVALALENAVLFVDQMVVPEADLSALCNVVGLAGGLVLVFGLVWDTD